MPEARALRRVAASALRAAGVESPERDADLLLAHALDVSVGALPLHDEVTEDQAAVFESLVRRRADREPLQHLTGVAGFRHVELVVGPGVFVPRPETELLAGWAIDRAREVDGTPVVVDLCTGSGAIAKAILDEVPNAQVYACELDPEAFAWAERNLLKDANGPNGPNVDLRHGDMAAEFDDLLGGVDVVVCNPPYIPLDAWESVAVEARDHDPQLALFAGHDGLDALHVLAHRAAELLRPGGVVGAEHADAQGEAAPAVFRATGRYRDVEDHRDLAGRPRFTTARLAR